MSRLNRLVTAVAVSLVMASPSAGVLAADSDLWVSVEGPATVSAGRPATYTVHYGNLGPDTAPDAYVNLELPPGLPAPFPEITQAQRDALAASAIDTDTLGNVPLLFDDFSCNGLLFQVQGVGDGLHAVPVAPLAPGDEGVFSVTVTFPMTLPGVGGLRVDAPADLAREITNLGRGTCYDCSDLEAYCFGEPLSLFDLGSRDAVLARDGSSPDPTLACDLLVGAYTDRIVVIRRGLCEFGTKARVAQWAGAAGAVIVNDGRCAGQPDDDDCVIRMAGELEGPFGFPLVMVSRNDGEPLIAALEAGREVRLTLGGRPTRDPRFEALIFHSTLDETDPDPSNDHAATTTGINRLPVNAPVRRAPTGRVRG